MMIHTISIFLVRSILLKVDTETLQRSYMKIGKVIQKVCKEFCLRSRSHITLSEEGEGVSK